MKYLIPNCATGVHVAYGLQDVNYQFVFTVSRVIHYCVCPVGLVFNTLYASTVNYSRMRVKCRRRSSVRK